MKDSSNDSYLGNSKFYLSIGWDLGSVLSLLNCLLGIGSSSILISKAWLVSSSSEVSVGSLIGAACKGKSTWLPISFVVFLDSPTTSILTSSGSSLIGSGTYSICTSGWF